MFKTNIDEHPELVMPRMWHVCGMWIEISAEERILRGSSASCHVCGMWIEIMVKILAAWTACSHATYVACGLKFEMHRASAFGHGRHATYVACGLKLYVICFPSFLFCVMPRMWHVD